MTDDQKAARERAVAFLEARKFHSDESQPATPIILLRTLLSERDEMEAEDSHARREALALATWLHRTCYAEVKDWKPFTAASSLLTQIDNMIAGVLNRLAKAEAERDKMEGRIANLIATQANELALMGLARNGYREERDALAERVAVLEGEVKASYKQGWEDREGDLLVGIDRVNGWPPPH
jgi:flagellar motility protein MotE (MotC chaperone)